MLPIPRGIAQWLERWNLGPVLESSSLSTPSILIVLISEPKKIIYKGTLI